MEPVYLRPLELDDLERIHQWHNDSRLYESLIGTCHFASRVAVEEWIRRKQSSFPQEVNLAVCLTETSEHIGNIYLRKIDWIARHAELGIFLGSLDRRSHGYGPAAARLLIKYAFDELGLHRVYAMILEDNQPSLRGAQKVGFVIEGKLREHVFKNGKYKDAVIVGICASDWSAGGPDGIKAK